MDSRPPVSVVIPNFNGLGHLQKLLPTLVLHSPGDTEIIVVDDASTDDSAAWISANYPSVILQRQTENGGFCRACNAGLSRARGRIVVALNNDTTVSPGWIEAALPHFDDPTVGSVAPLIVRMHEPETIDSAGIAYHACGWATDRQHRQPLENRTPAANEVFGPTMACAFYRRDALDRTGFLPVEFGAYFEDVDLAFRLRWAGYRCIHEPRSVIQHVGSATYSQTARRVTKLLCRNEELVWWCNLTRWSLFFAFPLHVGFQSVRFLRHLTTGRFLPYVSGKWDAFRMIGWILKRRRNTAKIVSSNPIRLNLDWSLNVFTRGVRWLKKRQND